MIRDACEELERLRFQLIPGTAPRFQIQIWPLLALVILELCVWTLPTLTVIGLQQNNDFSDSFSNDVYSELIY